MSIYGNNSLITSILLPGRGGDWHEQGQGFLPSPPRVEASGKAAKEWSCRKAGSLLRGTVQRHTIGLQGYTETVVEGMLTAAKERAVVVTRDRCLEASEWILGVVMSQASCTRAAWHYYHIWTYNPRFYSRVSSQACEAT